MKKIILAVLLFALVLSPIFFGKVTVNGKTHWVVLGHVGGETKMQETMNEEDSKNTNRLTNITEQLISRDFDIWDQLDEIAYALTKTSAYSLKQSTVEYPEGSRRNSSPDILNKKGIYEMNGFTYFYVGNEGEEDITNTWDELKFLNEVLGNEFDTFIEKAKVLKLNEYIETALKGFNVVAMRFKTEYYQGDSILIGIANSGLSFKDEVIQDKIERLCGDDLILQTVSCNDAIQYVELSYPSQIITKYVLGAPFPTVYYQVIMDHAGNFKDLKMIIAQDVRYVNENSPLPENVYNRLDTLLTELTGEVADSSLLKADIETNRFTGKKLSGSVGSLNYDIIQEQGSTYDTNLNLTVIHFTK